MKPAKLFLSFFNKLILLMGIVAISVGAYVHVHGEEASQRLHVLPWAAVLLVVAGVVAFVLSFVGCCAAALESRHFHALYFMSTLVVFTCVVAVTVATATNEPMVESFLKHECETNPWPNCKQDLPKIIHAAKDNLTTLFYGALSASSTFAVLMLLTVLAAGEAKAAEYYEIKTLGTPQFVSSV